MHININITNYCNQKCVFCFAGAELNTERIPRNMSLATFSRILAAHKDKSQKVIRLMGGEPCLHENLSGFLDLASEKNFQIHIFSNGILNKETVALLASYKDRVAYVFNISTPSFQHNVLVRNRVINLISYLGQITNVGVSLTITPFTSIDYLEHLKTVCASIHNVRIGVANPIAGEKNSYSLKDFPLFGSVMVNIISKLRAMGYEKHIALNCGLTRCMFSTTQFSYMKKHVEYMGWSCFAKEGNIDVSSDETAFHCFPFSREYRLPIKGRSLEATSNKLFAHHMQIWAQQKNTICKKCPHYGFGADRCPGPCLAFQHNQ
ncbi:hypothetical protein COY16_05845 [Candidatus Roizmanbacteria bacterium CG_4_10_14_0_2_um_filter_39_13]|uniref:Radical SAM core domain-containing protein n=1 Tax=Candidatus Roizmanbacteria bacterium CG_4_10_14_0_2_um_filter_39_13 TaxID=1974825 RepID=A0A2M7TVN2_9BACT|nr:MAG: hypothetical protein COY16_05845 [Candidatus Roizmanbacteria bacterium CG_4_10_14_0_2_um_filter_39_13]